MEYNSGVIRLVISNRPFATHSADLKLLAQLLPELYSTQSYYHYLLLLLLLLLLLILLLLLLILLLLLSGIHSSTNTKLGIPAN